MVKRRRLNKEMVVEAAAALANEQGTVETLALKELAAALDIRVPSLYNHIDGVEGLRHDLTVYGAQELLGRLRQASFGLSGRPAILAIADALRQFALDQPALYPLTIVAPAAEDVEMMQLSQELLQLLLFSLSSLGLEGEEALHAIRGLRALIHGFVSIELAGGYQLDLSRQRCGN